jgi:8-oxo-dGTP pyrophosphatase MutT (NUDIX family)
VCWKEEGGVRRYRLVRTSGGKRWTVPKGRIEPGEDPAKAALRELGEEAGDGGVVDPAPIAEFYRADNGIPMTLFIVAFEEIVLPPTHENRERGWFTLSEARDMFHYRRTDPGDKAFALQLIAVLEATESRIVTGQPTGTIDIPSPENLIRQAAAAAMMIN